MDSSFDSIEDILDQLGLDEEDLTWAITCYSREVSLRLS